MANGGLIVPGSSLANDYRELIIGLAVRHKWPAIYSDRIFVIAGGLVSVGPYPNRSVPACGRVHRSHSQGREAGRSAGAVPTKYELVINLKICQGAGPHRAVVVLARADEVVE